MIRKLILSLCITICSIPLWAQHAVLLQKINRITAGKKADIGISIIGPDKNDQLGIHADQLYPMLSTFKFPIALTVLHQIEQGRLTLKQELLIRPEDLLDNTWSPFREKYPAGNVRISLEEALTWMMCYSDNNITDLLLRLIGGTAPVQQFVGSAQLIGSKDFMIRNDENDMHQNWDAQFVNKISPGKATQLLEQFYQGKILNPVHTQWLYEAMLNNKTGLKRLKGKLPPEVKVAHRSGTSFTNKAGMTGAINSYGIIELPGNRKIVIAVFVHDTYESFEDAETIIADIAKATYDFYTRAKAEKK